MNLSNKNILTAVDIVIFSVSAEGLQKGLDLLFNYCKRWKLKINANKTKVIVFRKAELLPRDIQFTFGDQVLEMVNSFSRYCLYTRWLVPLMQHILV